MKKLLVCFVIVLLCGCSAQTVFETVEDVPVVQAAATARQLKLTLPEEAAIETMESPAGSLYICDGYTVSLQTLEGGDLDRSIRALTGLSGDALTVIKTRYADLSRYDTVWTSASESGDQTGRLAILDDGAYHYAVTVMADARDAGGLTGQWNELLGSIELVSTG